MLNEEEMIMALKKLNLELELSEEILSRLGKDPQEVSRGVLQLLILDLVRRGEITSSYGAELLGMDWQDFLDLMAQYKVPLINYEDKEVKEELSTLRRLTG
jgi:predicted HTH domain antitoxin